MNEQAPTLNPSEIEATEMRNDWGYTPVAEFEARENRGNISQNVDASNNKNDMVPWMAFAMLLSGGALFGLIIACILMPQLMDAKINAAVATRVAPVEAAANEARVQARVAVGDAQRMRAELTAKGELEEELH